MLKEKNNYIEGKENKYIDFSDIKLRTDSLFSFFIELSSGTEANKNDRSLFLIV